MNPKKKHQETPVASSSTEELWGPVVRCQQQQERESSATWWGSWEKKAHTNDWQDDWEQDRDAFYEKEKEKWMRTGQGAWQQKEEDYDREHGDEAYDPQKESDLQKEQDYDLQKACLEAYDSLQENDLQKEQDYDLQKENEQKEDDLQKEQDYDLQKDNEDCEFWAPTDMEIQGGADQLGGFGDMTGQIQQQPELPTIPVPHPIGNHNPPGTGAGRIRRAHRAFAVGAGTTNPFKEGLKCAEKQLRQCQRKGKTAAILFAAKNKVRDYHEKAGLWDHHRQTNIEGTQFITEFARQAIAAAADEYATLKFSQGSRIFGTAWRAEI